MTLGLIINSIPCLAGDIVYPTVFSNGQILTGPQLNGNFDAVTDVVNGAITNSNIQSGAAITLSKLDLTAQALNLRATGNPTWAAGVTGDTVPRVSLMTQGGIGFGPGSASAQDTLLKRTGVAELTVRDFADSADGTLKAGILSASGSLKLVNGFTLTLTPAAIAANRAITVPDPGTSASLPFYTGTLNTNGVIYTDGTTLKSTATGGAGTLYLTSVAGAAPSFAALSNTGSFGGNGSDGAVAISGSVSDSAVNSRNATTFIINNGGTLQIYEGTILNATSTFTVGQGSTGILDVLKCRLGGAAGSTTGAPTAGIGPRPGLADFSLRTTGYGGSGGGAYSAGGNGGGASALIIQASGLGAGSTNMLAGGSGGGGGGYDGTNAGGSGGPGGGTIIVCAQGAISIASGGSITAVGTAGSSASAGNGGGGGGGSGGLVMLCSQTSVVNSGSISVAGGNGGAGHTAGGGGGGGAGGVVVLWSPSNTAGSITLTAGTAGSGGTTPATAGTIGQTITITGAPSLPLKAWLVKNLNQVCALPSHDLKQRDVAALAANGDIVKYLTYMGGSLTETCEAIGDAETLANAA